MHPDANAAATIAAPPSPEETARRTTEALENGLRNEVIVSKQSLLRWSITIVISALLFAAHWRILRGAARIGH
jgi:hypothetical protein